MMENIYEIIGYVASVLVAISLSMSSIIKLRWFNLFGSAFFSIYGFLIQAYPVGILNGYIAIMNIIYLRKIYQTQDDFRILSYDEKTQYLTYFFDFYRREITKYNPAFDFQIAARDKIYIILRNMVPAGIVIGNRRGGIFNLKLDFVIPQFRDFKIGEYIYRHEDSFLQKDNINKVITTTESDRQAKYYERMGFHKHDDHFEFVI
ncbi:MAG: GNAT family N-acetyltransferase [Fidelibacterota bacterium]